MLVHPQPTDLVARPSFTASLLAVPNKRLRSNLWPAALDRALQLCADLRELADACESDSLVLTSTSPKLLFTAAPELGEMVM